MIKSFKPGDAVHLRDLLECYDRDPIAQTMVENFATAPNVRMFTLWVNDLRVACFGYFVTGHIMTIWALCSKLIKQYPFAYHKAVKKTLEDGIKEFHIVRVQSIVDVGNDVAVRHHEALGFSLEGTMKKSGRGLQDEYLFARVV